MSLRITAASICLAFLCPAASAELTVTAIDHAGFLFSDGKTKILADALLEPYAEWPFPTPSPALLAKMEKGEAPFDDIAILFISHDHIDHYAPDSTLRFLKAHPKTIAVTTPGVAKRLASLPGYAEIAARVVTPELKWKESREMTVNGVSFELDRVKHTDDGQWACDLDALVFTLGGKKVLFAPGTLGLFPEEYRALNYAGRGFDLAFLNYEMAINREVKGKPASLRPDGIAILNTQIPAKTTVLMHVETGAEASVTAMLPALKKQAPTVTLFEREGERRAF